MQHLSSSSKLLPHYLTASLSFPVPLSLELPHYLTASLPPSRAVFPSALLSCALLRSLRRFLIVLLSPHRLHCLAASYTTPCLTAFLPHTHCLLPSTLLLASRCPSAQHRYKPIVHCAADTSRRLARARTRRWRRGIGCNLTLNRSASSSTQGPCTVPCTQSPCTVPCNRCFGRVTRYVLWQVCWL